MKKQEKQKIWDAILKIEECFNDCNFDNVTTLYRCIENIEKIKNIVKPF